MVIIKDSILFFTEIYRNEYDSIFCSAYLSEVKKLHERYGTKFVFETGYSTPEFRGFDLSMMSDRYKAQWQENADWLLICGKDSRIKEEVERFAGEKTYISDPQGEEIEQRHFYIFDKNYMPDHIEQLKKLAK